MVQEQIPRSVKRDILGRRGVISVGRGVENGEDVVVITVEESSTLGADDFAREVAGLPVYIEQGTRPALDDDVVLPQDVPNDDPETRVRPVKPGLSTSNVGDSGSGTIGWVMTDGEQVYLSSNNHVWGSEVGDAILQPGENDNDEGLSTDERLVGHYAGRVNPKGPDGERGGERSGVDMAWGTVAEGVEVSTEVNGVGEPQGVRRPEPGDPLILSGQTSGLSEGECVEQEVSIDMGSYVLEDVIKSSPMSDGGDSGGPVMHDDGSMDAAGSHFAGDDNASYECNIDNWEGESGLKVITADHHWPGRNERPSADFNTSMDGLTVTVDGRPSSDPEGRLKSYQWTFDDRVEASGQTASHTFEQGGTYRISLTVTDDVGASWTSSKTFNVLEGKCTYKDHDRIDWEYAGNSIDAYEQWANCEITTREFADMTPEGDGTNQLREPTPGAGAGGGVFAMMFSFILSIFGLQ